MNALAAYHRATMTSLSGGQRALAEAREAERLGISLEAWRRIRTSVMSVELLRDIHVAATGRPANVRRANEHGAWTVVPPKPGHLRSRPQSFRVGPHVEPAWDHNTLKMRVAELLRATTGVTAAPFAGAAHLVWNLMRAQPFLGLNERTALLCTARLLNSVGLPLFSVAALEHDPEFAGAAIASEPKRLADVLERASWREALEFAEWLSLTPTTAWWSLHDEQTALALARENVQAIAASEVEDALHQVAENLAVVVSSSLEMEVSGCTTTLLEAYDARLKTAIATARGGRYVCPHRTMAVARCALPSGGLGAQVVIGAAGRGLTGAVSMNLAVVLGDVALNSVESILLVPNELPESRRARIAEWLSRAVPRAIKDAPVCL